jgi:hypothetical protein
VPPPPDNISIIDAGEIAQPFIFDSVIRGGKILFVGRLLLAWLHTFVTTNSRVLITRCSGGATHLAQPS